MRSTRERAMVNSFPMFPLVTMERAIGLAFLFSLSSLLYVLFFPSHLPMDSFTSYKGKQNKKKKRKLRRVRESLSAFTDYIEELRPRFQSSWFEVQVNISHLLHLVYS